MSTIPEVPPGFNGEPEDNIPPSGGNRIYQVPVESRELAFRERTEILRAIHKMELEGKLKPPKPSEPTISQTELLKGLRPHRHLLAHFLRTLTDEEFVNIIDELDMETGQPVNEPPRTPNFLHRTARWMGNLLHKKRKDQ